MSVTSNFVSLVWQDNQSTTTFCLVSQNLVPLIRGLRIRSSSGENYRQNFKPTSLLFPSPGFLTPRALAQIPIPLSSVSWNYLETPSSEPLTWGLLQCILLASGILASQILAAWLLSNAFFLLHIFLLL